MTLFRIGSSDPVILEFRPSTLAFSNFAIILLTLTPCLDGATPFPGGFVGNNGLRRSKSGDRNPIR
jgi:hypothetical protein